MIKPEELRIGDYVRVSSDNCMIPKGAVCKVVAIDSERACKDKKGLAGLLQLDREEWEISHGIWSDYIEGIPLTPDIFNKNDFTEEVVGEYNTKPLDNETHPFKRYLSVERESDNWAVFIKYRRLYDNALLRKIQYVHQLQHILWALGEDANLKI